MDTEIAVSGPVAYSKIVITYKKKFIYKSFIYKWTMSLIIKKK